MKGKTIGRRVLSALIISACAALPAYAQRPGGDSRQEQPRDRGGNDQRQHAPQGDRRAPQQGQHNDGKDRHGPSRNQRPGPAADSRFYDNQRTLVHDYYRREISSGRCPPGLSRKGKNCAPPARDRRWAVGRPLPREVIFHDLPPALVVEIGAPPAGYRYVRVASDILMIAVGTGLVVDAIQDLIR